jgi:phage-related protein
LAAEWGKFTGAITGAWDATVGFFRDLPGRISEFLSNLPEMLVGLAQRAFNALLFAVGFGIGAVIGFFRDLPGNIASIVSDLWERVKSLFRTGVDTAKTTVSTGFTTLIETAKTLPSRFMDALRELPGRLASLASDLAAKAVQLGRDIIAGVVRGIQNTIGTVKDTLLGGFNSAVAGVKRGLGISSPSRVFADIGEDTIAGYVKGIEDSARSAQVAVTTALVPPGRGPTSAPARLEIGFSGDGDDLVRAFREFIRVRYAGDPDEAFGTAA